MSTGGVVMALAVVRLVRMHSNEMEVRRHHMHDAWLPLRLYCYSLLTLPVGSLRSPVLCCAVLCLMPHAGDRGDQCG